MAIYLTKTNYAKHFTGLLPSFELIRAGEHTLFIYLLTFFINVRIKCFFVIKSDITEQLAFKNKTIVYN